ncbi:MAG: RNA polymerase sigma-70 factor [Bacteroidia bacterium]|nr:RNA polymerase sigma-70 factor [Bacteroidia bacterium]
MDVQSINLFQEIKQNNTEAYEKFFKLYYAELVRFAYEYLKDKDAAEDLVQEVFVKLWEKRADIEMKSAPKSYLYVTVKNHCLNKLKSEQRHVLFEDDFADDQRFAVSSASQLSEVKQLSEHIKQAMDKLPPRCGLIFKLSRFEEKSYKEIADILEISVKTVENQMGKALSIMRNDLKHYLQIILFFFICIK